MATIDEILAAMPEPSAEGDHEYLVIDPATRSITVPEAEKIFGVTGDELADRKYFICPRIVGDGLDLASMFIRVNFRNANGEEDGYLVKDVAVSGDYVTFSWQLTKKVAAYKGEVLFGVCADLPNTPDRKMPDWNTAMASGEVLEGLHPEDGDVEGETSDVVTQLRAETAAQTAAVEACGAEQVDAVEAAGAAATAEAVAAIQAQGEATKASIPADYTTLAGTVDRLTRDRAAAIVCEAEGTDIQVQDASNDPLQGLRIFGKSTQAGDPTPDNPVEIVSTPAPTVTVAGKNLANLACHSGETNYIALVNAYDLRAVKKGKQYTISVELHATAATRAYWNNAARLYGYLEFDVAAGTNRYTYSFTAGEDGALYEAGSNIVNKYPANDGVVITATNAQLELGGVATDYEPYIGQTLAITTPGSLPGIPVASGGNYTDANGQQWIADEVDLARGVYVQRVLLADYDGSDDERWVKSAESYFYLVKTSMVYPSKVNGAALATRFIFVSGSLTQPGYFKVGNAYGPMIRVPGDVTDVDGLREWIAANPFSVLYELENPIEMPLTDVEVQTFRALHSCKPVTTVLNDAGAPMVLEYAADPKTYIDNKLAALVAAKN